MILKEWLKKAEAQLAAGLHPERARRDAELLLCHVLGCDRAWLLTHLNHGIEAEQGERFGALLARRTTGEPIQYILGETEFYGLPFRVTPDVLIPRPETEHLVEKVLELAAQVQGAGAKAHDGHSTFAARLKSCPVTEPPHSFVFEAPRIVDVGTGSGCIAIALAHHLPDAKITAIDLSSMALIRASENAALNHLSPRIRLLEGDLLAPVAGERFEIIVSNPPYVPTIDRAQLSVEVREYEPAQALFAGEDGLEVYRRLIPVAFDALVPGGYLLLEIGYGQSPAITQLLTNSGFQQIEFVPDLQDIPRVACARRLS
ncbi:MAG: peptide chain release factor N(5)-glutamine methyltransferase [Terracidiphilus sp.]